MASGNDHLLHFVLHILDFIHEPFPRPPLQCLTYSQPGKATTTGSVVIRAPDDICAPCVSIGMLVWVTVRRLCLHRGFHAQGTTSRLTRLPSAMCVAKDLKTMRSAPRCLSSTINQSLVLPYSGSCLEGYIPFLFLLILHSDYVERICFFVIHRQPDSTLLHLTF
jgi:hypothetical protein